MYQIIYILLTFVFLVCVSIATPHSVHAAPPKDFQTTQIIGTGLAGPSGFDIAPDGRIFILQRTGEVKLYKNGQLLSQNFVTLPSIAEGDRGLIGITFDPNFSSNKLVYFYYTGLDKRNRLVRMDASTDIGKDLMVLYETTFLSEQLHVGGSIGFGLDGKLYLAVGDNGYPPNSQDLSNPHGKILRINRDGSIPVDNPFYGQPGKLPEIWAYGLRNPWRFQFDSVTGRLYDGDVGGSMWEEINLIQKGKNYGWPNAEGVCSWSGCPYANPAYTYPHLDNGRYYSSAVTQGPIYRGSSFPQSYYGKVFFGDYARGFIKTFTTDVDGNSIGVQDFDLQAGSVVDLKVASDGSLYYITYYPGALYKVMYNPANRTPVANATSDKTKGTDPFTVTFSSDGSYDPDGTPLTYSWNFGDGTSSTQANPTKTYTTKGTYNATLTVSDGVNTALSIPIVIQVGIPPKVTIGSPNDGATYRAGDNITYTAIALDAAGFDINDNDIVSEVIFHHDTHIHPFLGPLRGRSHTFTIPTTGEDSPNTWYAIHVTATDTNGLSTTETVEIYPVKSIFALKTEPAGLKVTLQGAPITTPRLVEAVVGYELEVNVPDGQVMNGKEYMFNHWSDGGAKKHTIVTSDANVSYTAHFIESTEVTTSIYDESLRDGWSDWSWSSANNFNDTAKPYAGQKNIQWKTTSSWSGLYLHTDNGFDTTGQHSLTLAVQATKPNQTLGVQLYGSNNEKLGANFVNITPYGGDPVVGSYKMYTIPLSVLSGENKRINGLHIQDTSGNGVNELYIDRIGFVRSQVALTPTPTQASSTPTVGGPTPTPLSSTQQVILYDESLRSGWEDWSWSSNNTFGDTTKPFAGTRNIRWQTNASWAGFYIHATSTFKTQGYEAIQFSIQATKDNQSLAIQLYDAQHNYVGNPVSLDAYGGKVPIGTYKTYTIPLSALGGMNKDIRGFYIQDTTGQTANVLFLDNIMIIGTATATPTPTQSVPTATPTSAMPTPTPTVAIPTPTPTQSVPTPTPSSKQLTIYDDALFTGWVDWSWSSTNNFTFSTDPFVGSKSLQWKPISGYAGLYFHTDNGVNLNDYTDLTFALKATKPDQEISLIFYDNNNATLGTAKLLSAYGGKPTVGAYKVYTLSLRDLGIADKVIKGFHLQDVSGSNVNEFFIDVVKLIHNGIAVPTPTPTQSVPTPPPSENSIPNNSMEIAEGDRPASWFSNTWGANTALFSYLTNGRTGSRSLRTEITSYSNGDAKWHFATQKVIVGKQYTFINYYKSNVTTYVVLQYTMNDGNQQYASLKEAPASIEWKEYKDTFVVPTNVVSVSVFHVLSSVGYLQVDDYSLVQQ